MDRRKVFHHKDNQIVKQIVWNVFESFKDLSR